MHRALLTSSTQPPAFALASPLVPAPCFLPCVSPPVTPQHRRPSLWTPRSSPRVRFPFTMSTHAQHPRSSEDPPSPEHHPGSSSSDSHSSSAQLAEQKPHHDNAELHGNGSDDDDRGGNHGDGNHGHHHHGSDGDDGDDGDEGEEKPSSIALEPNPDNQYPWHEWPDFLRKPLTVLYDAFDQSRHRFVEWALGVIKTVPSSVLVAFFSFVSTITGAKIKNARDAKAAERKRMKESQMQKREVEKMLRELYNGLAAPMLKSSAKLAERLHMLVDADWEAVEIVGSEQESSPLYSAYLLGRYLATVEIIKEKSATLDYGFPAADRILVNILGRLQGVLSANDTILKEMQMTEHLFRPDEGGSPLAAGPLRISPREQTVLGDLLFRKLWKDKYGFVDKATGANLTMGPKAIVTFLEFSRIMNQDPVMQKWYTPVIKDFLELENTVQSLPKNKRRVDSVGARIYFLQSALLDLVEFFDPLPHPQFIPFHRRHRLALGGLTYNEEQRAPQSLHKLYSEFANIRDHRIVDGNREDRLKLSKGIEVYIAGTYGPGEKTVQRTEFGDCPFSHRVLIALFEMGIKHGVVPIAPDAKPGWYYLLHPANTTPTIYYKGEVVQDSGHIVAYLMEKFPEAKRLASTDHLCLAVGTAGLTRFHKYFKEWVSGTDTARYRVEIELRRLNNILEIAQKGKGGKSFLGGSRFSREDTAVAPMLHNIAVAGKALKDWEIPSDCEAIKKYLAAARLRPSFVCTVARDDVIVEGYGRLPRKGSERSWRLADLLE